MNHPLKVEIIGVYFIDIAKAVIIGAIGVGLLLALGIAIYAYKDTRIKSLRHVFLELKASMPQRSILVALAVVAVLVASIFAELIMSRIILAVTCAVLFVWMSALYTKEKAVAAFEQETKLALEFFEEYVNEIGLHNEDNIYVNAKDNILERDNNQSNAERVPRKIAFNALISSLSHEIVFNGFLYPGVLSEESRLMQSSFSKLLKIGVSSNIISRDDEQNARESLNDLLHLSACGKGS